MKLGISIPDFSAHGGINIIIEWANRLNKYFDVTLFCLNKPVNRHWMPVTCKVSRGPEGINKMDAFIITSPHTVGWYKYLKGIKVFCFVQNIEHLFRPHDEAWRKLCFQFYELDCDKFYLANWNKEYLKNGDLYKVRNCANFDLFNNANSRRKKQILIEGIVPTNPTKDIFYIGQQIAERYHKQGFKIVSYGQLPYKSSFVEYYQKPNLDIIKKLYNESMLFVKCSLMDAMSTSPIEAGACNTPVIRYIEQGDDNLNEFNCYKSPYITGDLDIMVDNMAYHQELANNHVAELIDYTWDDQILEIKNVIE